LSYSLDVNVLLYASDEGSARHKRARDFIEACAAGPEIFCLAWPTVMSYLRISTHPRIFASPLTPNVAMANVTSLLRLPHVRPIAELDGFIDAYSHVTEGIVVRGNLVPDAHLATILFQHGVRTLYSHDRDFKLFRFLDLREPNA